MNLTDAKKYLKRAENSHFIKYHSGLVCQEVKIKWGGNTTGLIWGINIDGDGSKNHPFGCPKMIWDIDNVKEMFPNH